MSEKKQVQRRFSAPVSLPGSICKLRIGVFTLNQNEKGIG
jgi:hypothetical protein